MILSLSTRNRIAAIHPDKPLSLIMPKYIWKKLSLMLRRMNRLEQSRSAKIVLLMRVYKCSRKQVFRRDVSDKRKKTEERALADNGLRNMKKERGKAQNTNRSRGLKEDIGSKLMNTSNPPKPKSDSVPLVLVKGQCLIQEDMKEREGNQLSLHFAPFFLLHSWFLYLQGKEKGWLVLVINHKLSKSQPCNIFGILSCLPQVLFEGKPVLCD